MGFGPPPTSPFIYEARDYQGNMISASIPYDDTTKVINGPMSVHRDPACVYVKVIIGDPKSPITTQLVPAGDHTITAAQLASVGVTSINTVIDTQITASP
jgi:hypothetical protein